MFFAVIFFFLGYHLDWAVLFPDTLMIWVLHLSSNFSRRQELIQRLQFLSPSPWYTHSLNSVLFSKCQIYSEYLHMQFFQQVVLTVSSELSVAVINQQLITHLTDAGILQCWGEILCKRDCSEFVRQHSHI